MPRPYAKSVAANGAAFAKFGGRFLVRGGAFETPVGTARQRNVVIEFPSMAEALACYESPEYQAAKAIREAVSNADIVIVEGFGPE